MAGYVVWGLADGSFKLIFRELERCGEKLVGLLGTTAANAGPVVLCGCSSVHTFGMRYALDIALVSKEGEVIVVRHKVEPWHVVSAHGAYFAFERPASSDPWFVQGSRVDIDVRRAACLQRRSAQAVVQ